MRFGTYHVFQCPPGQNAARVVSEELERAVLAEAMGYDEVWVPEQHFSPYCLCGDALLMAATLAERTSRVRIGTAIVNLTFTHPLRFLERVAILDHATGGRVDVGIGRGYQIPQYGVFQVPMDATRAIFNEALDIALSAWGGGEFAYHGKYFEIPRVSVWPVPERKPEEVLLHAVASRESMGAAIERGLPAIMARPLTPYADQVEELRRYRVALEAAGADVGTVMRRSTVLKYAFLAASRREAHRLPREAFEWDMEILQKLTTPDATEMPSSFEMYQQRTVRIPELQYDEWTEKVLLFDEPEGCIDKVHQLREAGVERLVLWMGPGGPPHELLVQSMRLFAEKVAPHFR